TIEVAGVRATFRRTQHPIHTLAIRLATPAGVLTYSSDTGPETDIAGFARGSDLALFEATYQEAARGAPVHLSAVEAAERARRAGAGRLALTHVWPPLEPRISLEESAAVAGDVAVSLALPGGVYEIGAG